MPASAYSPSARLEFRVRAGRAVAAPTAAIQEEVLDLFDTCAPGLRRYIQSCGLPPDVADDVVQETFLALFRHLCGGGARHNLRGWLVQVSYRLALKQRERLTRRQQREAAWEPHHADLALDPSNDPEAQLLVSQHRDRLQSAYRALPERERHCLSLRAEGLRYRDIARTLGISLGAVAKALTYAVSRLSNSVRG